MRTKNANREYGLPLNMTPMIDVVFLLLIFFLVSSQYAQMDYEQAVNLPEAESGIPQEQAPPTLQRLVVHVDGAAALTIAGKPASATEFQNRLAELVQRVTQAQVEVRIRADRTVPYRAIEPLLLACAREGIWRVNFAVLAENAAQK